MIIEKRRVKASFIKKYKSTLIIALVCTGFLGPYVGVFVYSMEEYNSHVYNLQPPDNSTFVEANPDTLHAMAKWFEENIVNYHMPHDMIVNTHFKSFSKPTGCPSEILGYSVTYDSAEWTGHYLMAEAFRYAVHIRDGQDISAQETLDNIEKALRGVDKILHVSGNGGMARYAWPIDEYPKDPDNIQDDNHYRVTWNGSEYILEDDTSRDMHNGIIMGLGFVYLLVDDSEIRNTVKRLVETMLDYFISTGWLYVKPTDDPNGTDLQPNFYLFGTSGIWTLAYLKVGVKVNPAKYGALWDAMAVDYNFLHRSSIPWLSRTNVVQAYYGLLLDFEVLFLVTMLEENPQYREIYLDYIGTVYNYIKYDRNAQFNQMWLAMNGITRKNANSEQMKIIKDVEDCLMRYNNATQRFPGRSANLTNPNLELNAHWREFYENGLGSILYPFWQEIYQYEVVALEPLTPDLRPQTDYLWSRPPYWYQQTGDGTWEGPGVDYIAVYWPCRYYNIIEDPYSYSYSIEPTYGGS